MKRLIVCACLFLIPISFFACAEGDALYSDQFWVVTSKANIYGLPNALSKVVGDLKFGDPVLGRYKKPMSNTPKSWLQIKIDPKTSGYVEMVKLGDKTLMDELNALIDSVKDKQVQATGIISKKSRFRLAPGRDARLLEFLKSPVNAEVFERTVTKRDDNSASTKDIWYKVRLEDGRVGYVNTSNIKFTPPADISFYTQSRRPVAWRLLRTSENQETGLKGNDYVTTYMTQGLDIGADFNRIEVYTFDTKTGKYSTAFAKSGIRGILPLNVFDADGGRKTFQFRQIAKGKEDKLLVQEYSFPSPIKVIKQYEEDTAVTLH